MPQVLGNGPNLLGIMSQFGIMLHWVLCHNLALCCIGYYVAFEVMSLGIMLFGIMLHSE